jgi:site-specific recombinase XerD
VRGWIDYLKAGGFADHTLENYTRPVTRLLMEVDFRDATLQDLVTFSLSQPVRSAHITFSALRSFYGYAVSIGELQADPTTHLKARPQARTIPAAFTPDELDRLRAAGAEMDPRYPAAIDFLYSTGARIGEAVAVVDADVTPDAVILRKTKARPGGLVQERAVPLAQRGHAAVQTLQDHRKAGPTVFGVGRMSVYEWVRECGRRAGIYVRPHLFRATFATHLAQRGVDIVTISRLLGHTNIGTTQRDVATTDERLRDAVLLLA